MCPRALHGDVRMTTRVVTVQFWFTPREILPIPPGKGFTHPVKFPREPGYGVCRTPSGQRICTCGYYEFGRGYQPPGAAQA